MLLFSSAACAVPARQGKAKGMFMFPWWCVFIAYGLSALIAAVSLFFIIIRGIEFGDTKIQKWLTTLLSSFFSSVILVQPVKVSVEGCREWVMIACSRSFAWRSSSRCSADRMTRIRRRLSSSKMIKRHWTATKSTCILTRFADRV